MDENSKMLVLGSLPSDESLRLQQYYANRSNQFWPILSRIFGEPIGLEYAARVAFLRRRRLALWDVLLSADRDGSSDAAIQHEIANDFPPLFSAYPALHTVIFNGGKAQDSFNRCVSKTLEALSVNTVLLPSTSRRYALSLDEKVKRWEAVFVESKGPRAER